MEFTPKTVTLKNGQPALLRSPDPAQAADMLAFFQDICSETEFLIMSPEDEPYTREHETKFLANMLSSDIDMMIVCEVDGQVAGNWSPKAGQVQVEFFSPEITAAPAALQAEIGRYQDFARQ